MTAKKRKKRVNQFGVIAICMVLVVFTCVLSVKTVQLQEKQKQYDTRIQVLERQISEEEQYAAQLEEERIYVQTKQYVEKIAREKLGLVNADELLVKPREQ